MKAKKIISFLLCVVMFALCFYAAPVVAAEEIRYSGVVRVKSNSYLSVRKEPNAESDKLAELHNNDLVTIHGGKRKGIASDTREWYKIEWADGENGFAYVCADYIVNVIEIKPPVEYEPDADFEENLEKQGFPESYKVLLRQLYAAHPDWIFLADHINLTWAEVLAAETEVGRSLVSISRPDSYKSMAYGAYDWDKATYTGFDGSSWVNANPDVTAYYLDPRNFLNENGIFQFLDQSYDPNLQTIEGVQKIVTNSFLAGEFPEEGYSSYAELIMKAGEISKVSPYVLAAMIIQEQGRAGTSGLISGNYSDSLKGFYNHFNIGAYASGGLTAVQRGLRYARGDYSTEENKQKYDLPWTSRVKSIIGGSIWFGTGYINIGQDTLYYKKWDFIGPNYYSHQYMTNVEGANSEALILKKAYADIPADTALVFSIPVFAQMPEENKTALPTTTGANNFYLNEILVDSKPIHGFDRYKNEYEMVVDGTVTKLNVSATAVPGATVVGAGEHLLEVGENKITLTVTAASGKTADYNILVVRKEPEEVIIPDPDVVTDYKFGDYVTGVAPDTEFSVFMGNFQIENGTLKVFDAEGKEKTKGLISTGDRITIYKNDGAEFITKSVLIYGDINGNGKIDSVDLIRLRKKLIDLISIDGIYSVAADINRDGQISSVDLIRIRKHLIGLVIIEQ